MEYAHQMMDAELETSEVPAGRGLVVAYWQGEPSASDGHESGTLAAVARALAAIKGYRYAGIYDPRKRYFGHLYFVPNDTLLASEVRDLPVSSEDDLFGGVVRYPFVATKCITHPLVDERARAPEGWSTRFPQRVRDHVLEGYAAFSVEDARRAGQALLQAGPARLKLANGVGGSGQTTFENIGQLDEALHAMDQASVSRHGLVVEQDLDEVVTLSVGQVQVGPLLISYHGTQRLTENNQGEKVYGGSDVTIVKGDFDTLLASNLAPDVELAVRQAMTYDAAARAEFAGFFASRRNYDVAQGLDAEGCKCSGVLEQSWRSGGATPAELAAMRAFVADGTLKTVRAASVEVYGACAPPEGAAIIFRGVDPKLGALTKYSVLDPDGIVS